MSTAASLPAPRTELGGVERGLQQASGIGVAAFAAQGLAVAVVGWPLYPAWWYAVPGPAMAVALAVTVVTCLRGRSRPAIRLVVVAVITAGAVATAVATDDTVHAVGNVASPLVTAIAILLGLFEPPALALSAGTILISGQLVSVALTRPLPAVEVLTVAAIQVAVLLSGAVTRRILRQAAVRLDSERDRVARSVAADRVAAATRRDRREQERRLHDTVLSTLTALARSSLSESDLLRRRCAADARYLRTLQRQTDDASAPGAGLLESLRALARHRAAPGLRTDIEVHPNGVVPPLPDDVVDALTRAVGEGVANAARHSGADAVAITVHVDDGVVTVEVVDRGHGTVPAGTTVGLGISRSIIERMSDVGGHGRVQHVPGSGTRVVLTWPR